MEIGSDENADRYRRSLRLEQSAKHWVVSKLTANIL